MDGMGVVSGRLGLLSPHAQVVRKMGVSTSALDNEYWCWEMVRVTVGLQLGNISRPIRPQRHGRSAK